MSVDDVVGALLDRLQRLDEFRDTLIVFTSDNGFTWGEHGLRVGGKSTPYAPSIEVPLFMRWPDHTAPGALDPSIVALLDLAPTILAATGTPAPHSFDGIDALDPAAERSTLLLEFHHVEGEVVPDWGGLITRGWEFVEYYDSDGVRTFREYYALDEDPYQLDNRLGNQTTADDPDVGALSAQLAAFKACSGSSCVS